MGDSMEIEENVGSSRRRDELYGAGRRDALRQLKGSLTEDHIQKLNQEGHNAGLPPWSSTTKTTFMGSQPRIKATSAVDPRMQNRSHFQLRGDDAPIDGTIYKSSLTNADYDQKDVKKVSSMKMEDQINLPDMNPRYWTDSKCGESFYDTDFSQMVKQHKRDSEAAKVRQRNLRDLRSTHFSFGNDPTNFLSETSTSFDTSRPRSGPVKLNSLNVDTSASRQRPGGGEIRPEDLSPAQFVKKMLADERESYVFRDGDYNVKVAKEEISTFSRDYDAMPKPNKSAAFVEPTQVTKGRFLQDANDLREFMSEENKPWNTDKAPLSTASESNISILSQLFLQYDKRKTSYVSKPILKRVLDSLLDPIPADQVEHLLRYSRWGEDGSVDYNDFLEKYADSKPFKESKPADVLGTFIPPTSEQISTAKNSSLASRNGNITLTSAAEGKSYQTSVHFEFGSDKDKPSSIYNKDFDTDVKQDVAPPVKHQPPQSSGVMHIVPGVGFGESSKQTSYVDFSKSDGDRLRQILDDRNAMSVKNKRRHNLNSVIMTGCDSQRDAKDRQKSLSHSSYVMHIDAKPPPPAEKHQPLYNYLKTDMALPFAISDKKVSEAQDAYSGPSFSNVDEEQAKLDTFKSENRERVKDGKKVHFKFGNDKLNHVSEAMDQFNNATRENDVMPAGKTTANDPHYAHIESSKNTLDLNGNPMALNNIDRINMAKKSYYNTSNPKDPLHISLRQALMDKDPEQTGHVTRRELRDTCSNFQINISSKAMDRHVRRCDTHDDGSAIDYHQFVRALTMEQVPDDISAAHSSSIMRQDYKPLEQRSFTDAQLLTISHMEKKPIKPQQSHFFHMDSTGDSGMTSMTNQDYIKPELQMSS